MKPPEDGPDQYGLDEFRRDAELLGFGEHEDDAIAVSRLESADEFIARMKGVDAQDRFRRRRRMAFLAAGSVAAAAAIIFGVLRPGGTPPAVADSPAVLDFEFASAVKIAYAPGEDPAEVYSLLIKAVEDNPADVKSGPIQYTQTDDWYSELENGSSKIVPRLSENWLRPDGSFTTHDTVGRALRSDGRGALPRDDSTGKVKKETLPAGSTDADFARSLSTDPTRLLAQLMKHSGCEHPEPGIRRSVCLYREITNLYLIYVVPPDLTKAIWTMMSKEEGFRGLGSVTDRAGRAALGLSIIDPDAPQVRHIILASLDTGQVVGWEDILIKRQEGLDVKPPAVMSFSTILRAFYTDSAPGPD